MSIQNKLKVVNRVLKSVSELRKKYAHDTNVSPDLTKLHESLSKLERYLSKLDQLQPNYTTNEINQYMVAINLDLDILKGRIEKNDYAKLQNGIKVIKTILKFHPTKYSFIEFAVIWFYELLYFI